MQINQPRRDDAVGVHNLGPSRQRQMRTQRHNAAILHQHRALLDHRLRHHERSGQRDRRLLSLRGQG